MKHTAEEFFRVKRLMADGLSMRRTAELAEIPYATIRSWNRLFIPPRGCWRASYDGWRPPDAAAYCYLLGLYLGDGCISTASRGSPQLVITLDARYPVITCEAANAMKACFPDARVGGRRVPGAIAIYASHPALLHAFSQHGPGRKHTRKIELAPWQLRLTHRHPEALIRGLIHSDGSRIINRFDTLLPSGRLAHYEYVRYFFTNYSHDIRAIFCEHCDLLGIGWTQPSFKNISISHRESTAMLDTFVGPKR